MEEGLLKHSNSAAAVYLTDPIAYLGLPWNIRPVDCTTIFSCPTSLSSMFGTMKVAAATFPPIEAAPFHQNSVSALHLSLQRTRGLGLLPDPKAGERPKVSTIDLIKFAILGSPDEKASFRHLWRAVVQRFPYFETLERLKRLK